METNTRRQPEPEGGHRQARSLSQHRRRVEHRGGAPVILNFSDGEHSLLEISDRSGIQYPAVREAAETLKEHDLLAEGDRAT